MALEERKEKQMKNEAFRKLYESGIYKALYNRKLISKEELNELLKAKE